MDESKRKEVIAQAFSNAGVLQINSMIVLKKSDIPFQFPDFPDGDGFSRNYSFQSRLNAKTRAKACQKSKENIQNGKVKQEPAPQPLRKRNSRYSGKHKNKKHQMNFIK
jgi:hypothetical protein